MHISPKYVPYHLVRHNGYIAQVAYVILDDNCVFTACQRAALGSTINMVEDVAAAIAKNESRDVSSLRFFDIQTIFSYGKNAGRYEPGDFIFDEAVFGGTDGVYWHPTVCPQHVSKMFSEYIGEVPNQKLPINPKPGTVQKVEFMDPASILVPPQTEFREPPPGVVVLAEQAIEMGATCFDCGTVPTLNNIRFWDHGSGWIVEGMDKRQWLSFECSTGDCRYGTSFSKFNFPGKK